MRINKFYVLAQRNMSIFPSENETEIDNDRNFEGIHYKIFTERLQSYTSLEVELLVEDNFLYIPEDSLIIAYAHTNFWNLYFQHPQCHELSFSRRFFIIGMTVSSEFREKTIWFPNQFNNHSFIGVFYPPSYEQSLKHDKPANIPVYYYLDALAMENNIKTWAKERQIDIVDWYLSGTKYLEYKPHTNSIQELCIFLEEYAEKYDTLKEINHFDNSEEMKAKVLHYFGKKTSKKTNIFHKIIDFFSRSCHC